MALGSARERSTPAQNCRDCAVSPGVLRASRRPIFARPRPSLLLAAIFLARHLLAEEEVSVDGVVEHPLTLTAEAGNGHGGPRLGVAR